MTTLVLSVRVSEEERALLEAASELARTSLSEFIRRRALDAAEMPRRARSLKPTTATALIAGESR